MINRNKKVLILALFAFAFAIVHIFQNRKVENGKNLGVNIEKKVQHKPSKERLIKIVKKDQEEGMVKLVSGNIDFLFISDVGNNLFYRNQDDSKFYKYDLSSKKESPISGPLPFIESMVWSPDGSRAIFYVYQNNYFFEKRKDPFFDPNIEDNKHYYWVYDFGSGKLKRIGDYIHIQNPVWSPDSKNIIYFYRHSDGGASNGMYVADADFSNQKKISNLFFYEADIAFFSEKEFLLSEVLHEAGVTELYKGDYKSMKVERILPNIFISEFNLISNNLVFLCIWDSDREEVSYKKLFLDKMLLVDLKQDIGLNANMVSDSGDYALFFRMNSDNTYYEIYKIDLKTGRKEKLKISIPYTKGAFLERWLKNDTIYFFSNGSVYRQKLVF